MNTPNGHTVNPQNPSLVSFLSFLKGSPTLHVLGMELEITYCGVPQLIIMTGTLNGQHALFKNMKATPKDRPVSFHSVTGTGHSLLAPMKMKKMDDSGVVQVGAMIKRKSGVTVLTQDWMQALKDHAPSLSSTRASLILLAQQMDHPLESSGVLSPATMMKTHSGHIVNPQNTARVSFLSNSTTSSILHAPEKVLVITYSGVPQLLTMTGTLNGRHVPFKNMKGIPKASPVSSPSSTETVYSTPAPTRPQRMGDFGVPQRETMTRINSGAIVQIQVNKLVQAVDISDSNHGILEGSKCSSDSNLL